MRKQIDRINIRLQYIMLKNTMFSNCRTLIVKKNKFKKQVILLNIVFQMYIRCRLWISVIQLLRLLSSQQSVKIIDVLLLFNNLQKPSSLQQCRYNCIIAHTKNNIFHWILTVSVKRQPTYVNRLQHIMYCTISNCVFFLPWRV